MLFATYSAAGGEPRPGLVRNGRIHSLPFPDMRAVIEAGEEAAAAQASPTGIHLAKARLHAPLRPTTLRDAYAFEQHVQAANRNRGREVPQEWYQFPVFYFANPHNIFGPNDEIPFPANTQALDFELEIAVVIGRPGADINAGDAERHIFGYTIFNDWSARDIQRLEMMVGLGPAKGKDFASSFGPYIATPDEFGGRRTTKVGVFELEMTARVNGSPRSSGNFKDIHWSFGDIIARASQNAELKAGDVIGSGTVGSGCLLELTRGQGPWLQPGDVVELEIERIGVLRNQVSAGTN